MSTIQLDTGKTWVATALISHARKIGIIVVAPKFVPSEDDKSLLILDFRVGGKTYRESFQTDDLESCASDPKSRTRLTQQIRKLVESLRRAR